jgi:hypothetical protein
MNLSLKTNCVIRLLLISYLCFLSLKTEAQALDRMIKKDSTEMFVIVQDTDGDSISYRYYGQPKDSLYTIAKSAVSKIVLKNGGGIYYPKPVLYNADGTVKLSKRSRIYVDATAGFTLRLSGLADVNIGYRFDERQAIGLSRIGMGISHTSASGLGIQYRFTPSRQSLFKLELGVITGASSFDESGPEIYTYSRKASSNAYVRIGAAVRFGSIFTLGINYVGTGPLTFGISGSISPNRTSWTGSMGFFCPQIGVALPPMPKKRKR